MKGQTKNDGSGDIIFLYSGGRAPSNVIIAHIDPAIVHISNEAFSDCKELEYVVFHDGIMSIGNVAFDNCFSLELITMPSTKVFDRQAFSMKILPSMCSSSKTTGIRHWLQSVRSKIDHHVRERQKLLIEAERISCGANNIIYEENDALALLLKNEKLPRKRRMVNDNARTGTDNIRFYVSEPNEEGCQKRFGLIEGIGGGCEEEGLSHLTPHRGRILELPGAVKSGQWETRIMKDAGSNDGGSSISMRISLRQNNSSFCPLENIVSGKDDAPDEHFVSIIKPEVTRKQSLVNHGILQDKELDDEEQISNNAFIGCISLVLFDGFLSLSESINLSGDVASTFLKNCVPSKELQIGCDLYGIVGNEHDSKDDENITGVLYPCNVSFHSDHIVLVLCNEECQVCGLDIVFHPSKDWLSNHPLTEALLRDRYDIERSGSESEAGEIMRRYLENNVVQSQSSAHDYDTGIPSSLNAMPEASALAGYQYSGPADKIDERDKDDPLCVTSYVQDMYGHFRSKEATTSVRPVYMDNQPYINERMRSILIDWLVEVHLKLKLFPETLYLTINIIDRYLAKAEVKRAKLQLVGVTALLIASKYEEIYPPELKKDFVYICDNAYTEHEILEMEGVLLKQLDYRITIPSAHTFLVRYLKAAHANKMIVQLSCYILDGTLQSYNMLHYLPSQLAAASILIARTVEGRNPWSPTLLKYTQYREENIKPIARAVLDAKASTSLELKAVNKKYARITYGCVANLTLPTDL